MLKKSLLLMLLMALLAPWAANGQGTLPIGNGTSYSSSGSSAGQGSGSPMGNTYYYNSAAQFIYTASELGGAKTINSLAFYHNAQSFSANLKIYLTHTTSATVDVNSPATDGTLVYDGASITIGGSSAGWQTFDFDNNFEYNGTDNLLVVVCRTVYNYGYSSSQGWQYTATTGNQFMVRSSDTGTYGDITNTSNAYTAFANRPNVIIGYVVTTPYVSLDPANATIVIGHTQDLTASYGNVSGTPTIIYSSSNSKVASVTGSGTTATVTGVSAGTATITATMVYNATNYYAYCAVTVEEPSYCTPTFGNPSDDYIANFATTGGATNIDNTTTYETGGYSNYYEAVSASIEAGETLSCTVTPSSTSYTYGHAIWVDWNKNYEFEASERVAYSTAAAPLNWTGEFEVPVTTAAGDYRLRVLHVYNYNNVTDPCLSANYGEGEDYKLTVTAANPYQKPVNLQVSALTAHEATISWTAPNTNVQSYKYQYKEEGGEWTALQSTTATEAPLTGLTAEKHHIFQVQAIYAGGNESTFASIEFDTEIACAAPTNLAASNITDEGATLSWDGSASSYNVRYRTQRGFHYDFEQAEVWTYDNFPPCTTYDGDGVQCYGFSGETYTNFPFIGSTFAFQSQGGNLSSHSGDVFGLMVCPNDASAADDWFILPAITIENGYVFQFYAREITSQYGDETINVGIYGDTPGTFAEVIDADVAIGETTYTLHSYDLSAYAGQTIRLAINYVSADIFGFMFDDIFVGNPNDNTWDVTENKVTSPYPIVGLTELTTYDFEVQADCGGGETSSWVATSFTTLPSCMPVSNLAVSDITTTTVGLTWEDNNGGTASYIVTDGDDNPMTVTNLTVTGCTVTGLIANTLYTFKVSADCGSTTVSIQARTECDVITTLPYDEGFETVTYYCWALDGFSGLNNSTYAHTGNMSIYADGSSTDSHHIILPEMGNEISDLMLNFWYYNFNAGIDCGTLYVGYVTDPDDFTTFTEVGYIDMSSGINEYAQSQDFVFTGAPAGSRMAIDYDASGENYAYVMIDDARIDIAPNCVKPYDLLVYDETTHGATFEWTSNGSETEWHLYISTDPTAPADDIPVAKVTVADSNPFTVTTGLDPETDYYVWVRANCGGSDYSAWAGPETFTTEIACPAPTGLAYSEVTAHTAKLSWDGTSDSYNVRYRTAATATSTQLFFDGFEDYDDEAALEAVWTVNNPNSGETVGLSTSAAKTGTNGFQFSSYNGASANQYLISPELTVSGVLEFAYKRSSSGAETFRVGYSTTTDDIDQFSNWETFTATSSSWATYSKDIPTGAKYFAINYTSSNKWYLYIDDITIYEMVPAGTWTEKTADASPYTAKGLLAETKYEAQVQSNCGGEGTSQWTSSVFFTTDIACPAPSALTASNATSSSFDLQWINGGAEDWIVAYKVDGAAYFTEVSVNISEVTEEAGLITYTLGGLDPETDYIVKVRDNCEASIAGDGYSAWTDEVAYSTVPSCSALNPVVDPASITHHDATVNFDGESATGFKVKYREAAEIDPTKIKVDEGFEHSGNMPDDWTHIGSGSLTINSTSSRVHAGSYSLRFSGATSDNIVVLPELDVEANTLLISFWSLAENQNYSGTFQVGYVTDATDASTFQTIGNYEAKDHLSYTSVENLSLASAPNGARIAFRHTSANASYWWWIDDVVVGAPAAAGEWQIVETGTTSAYLTNLEPGTMYDVKVVPNCDNTIESATVQFTTLPDNVKYFLTAGDWNNADNWMDSEIPTIDNDAVIRANANIFGDAAANKITFSGSPTPVLTIENGGTLQTNTNVAATVKKHITGYGAAQTDEAKGYYLIANPLNYTVYSSEFASVGLTTGNYDLYSFSYVGSTQPGHSVWNNYKNSTFSMSTSTGYLYANETDIDLAFQGTVKENNTDVSKSLTYNTFDGSSKVNDLTLAGNPFACNAYIKDASSTEIAFYRMKADGSDYEVATGAIRPMEGIFVKATASGQTFKFTRTAPVTSTGNGNLNIQLAKKVTSRNEVATTDKAIVRFDGGNTLEKLMLHQNSMKLYIPQNGTDFAVVASEGKGVLPVNVRVATAGNYTISVSKENVQLSYLHLIDRFTGEDIDLLINDSYTFTASPRDKENRFDLVFHSIDSNIDIESEIFAYQSDDEIIVSGEGELQIFDVLGHFVTSMRVNGSERISASTFANGVYVFRMVGNEVKTQKIVVR